ncbi:GNAT family N-acetyltransferase [Winogradskyella sp.]|uniref:GNAT family N-acetyltransferase n=1 Tax=Winogradskyella sp. TaxID=1883156 RepID=UPI003BA87353
MNYLNTEQMIGLETERLYFRQWAAMDYPIFAEFFSNEVHAKYVGGLKTPEESYRLMASYIGHYTLNGFSYLAVEEKASKNLIGTIGLWKSAPWPEPELGYWLLPQFQGKGFGVEAGLAVKDFALKQLKLDTLVSYIDPNNEPSKTLALRLGARLDSKMILLDFGIHEVYRYQ